MAVYMVTMITIIIISTSNVYSCSMACLPVSFMYTLEHILTPALSAS